MGRWVKASEVKQVPKWAEVESYLLLGEEGFNKASKHQDSGTCDKCDIWEGDRCCLPVFAYIKRWEDQFPHVGDMEIWVE